ncbi:MAG: ABC transporter substrate-binding protein [Syntrophaceticus sp.]|nr:ABC transporter substrate-binding protein [Syntrophaceticus sp.]MDD3315154.1 ABC transporter substrate-binding protein [Syntrophaceticus sp.]
MNFRGKKGKSVALLTVLVFVLGIFAAGCGGGTEESPADGDTIKVGINLELSGAVATYGTGIKNGAELAFEEINADGGVLGKEIEVLVQDNKSQNREARNIAEKLIGEGVVAVIGPATSGNVQAEVPVLTDAKIPVIAPAATAPEVTYDEKTDTVKEYVFRVCFIDPDQSQVMAQYILDELGLKKGAMMVNKEDEYSIGLGNAFREYFTTNGGEIVAEEGFITSDTAFKSQLTSISSKNPEFIYVPTYYNQVGLIIKQARELGIELPMMGADGWDSPKLVSIAGAESLQDCYFTNHYSIEDPAEHIQSFVKAYDEKYGATPDSFAALGYDAGYLLAEAIEQAGSAEPEKIQEALANIKDFEGISGEMTIDEKHFTVKDLSIIKLVDGQQTLINKLKPER